MASVCSNATCRNLHIEHPLLHFTRKNEDRLSQLDAKSLLRLSAEGMNHHLSNTGECLLFVIKSDTEIELTGMQSPERFVRFRLLFDSAAKTREFTSYFFNYTSTPLVDLEGPNCERKDQFTARFCFSNQAAYSRFSAIVLPILCERKNRVPPRSHEDALALINKYYGNEYPDLPGALSQEITLRNPSLVIFRANLSEEKQQA